MNILTITLLAMGLATAAAGPAAAQTERCEAKRHGAVGKYDLCLHKTRAKAAAAGESFPDFTACGEKLAATWTKLALSAPDACPDGDLFDILDVAEAANDVVSDVIAGAPAPSCGDGELNLAGEQCDGSDLDGESCATFGYDNPVGVLACDGSCRFDLSGCLGTCGDNKVDAPGEACDGTDLNGRTCSDLGLGGSVTCLPNCQLSTSECFDCGDGVAIDGHCYYMGGFSATCNDVCSVRGMAYDAAGTVAIGSGGTAQQCWDVLEALEVAPSEYHDSGSCGAAMYGTGCNVHPSGWWTHCSSPATTASAGGNFFRRACACSPM